MMRPALLPLFMLLGAAPASAPAGTTVLELFTSQGCSSCPPADRLLAKVAGSPGVIVLTRPVTYWDRLGWKDTLARPENTALQYAYQRRFQTRSVYTPQLVADGSREWVGSNRTRLVAELRQRTDSARVALARTASGKIAIGIAGQATAKAEVKLVELAGERSVDIGRGENGGRRVTYTNVVLAERVVAGWSGGTRAYTVDGAGLAGDRVAVIVQAPNAGPILGAAIIAR